MSSGLIGLNGIGGSSGSANAGSTAAASGDAGSVDQALGQFALELAYEAVTAPVQGAGAAAAKKLPNSPENIFAQMQNLRQEDEARSEKARAQRAMLKKELDYLYRS